MKIISIFLLSALLSGCATTYLSNHPGVSYELVTTFKKASICGTNIFVDYDVSIRRPGEPNDGSNTCKTFSIDLSSKQESRPPFEIFEDQCNRVKNCEEIPIKPDHDGKRNEFISGNKDICIYTQSPNFYLMVKNRTNSNLPDQYWYYEMNGKRSSAWRILLAPIYPVALAFDVATFPVQIALVFKGLSTVH